MDRVGPFGPVVQSGSDVVEAHPIDPVHQALEVCLAQTVQFQSKFSLTCASPTLFPA